MLHNLVPEIRAKLLNMAIKRKNKVSAAFSMSSLTDIIFLLLIFFMLTSSVVAPNALNLKLPGSSNQKVMSDKVPDEVRISTSGRFYLNGKSMELDVLEEALQDKVRGQKGAEQLSMTIAPASGTPTEHVVAVMDIAIRLHINGILATEKPN